MNELDELQKYIDELISSIGIQIKSSENDIKEIVFNILEYYSYRGELRSDDTDFKLLRDLENQILVAVNQSGYLDNIEKLILFLDKIEEVTKAAIVDTNTGKKFTKSIVDLTQEKKIAIENIALRLSSPESIKINITNDVKKIIYTSVKSGVRLSEAKDILGTLISGDTERGGSLSRYYSTIATDTLNQWQGTVSQTTSEKYGLIDYFYAGDTITTSRPQCIRWANAMGGRLVKEIVEYEMQRARPTIRRPNNDFSGYSVYAIPSVVNFPVIRGGHNCRHTAIPYLATVDEANRLIKKFNSIEGTNLVQKYTEFRS